MERVCVDAVYILLKYQVGGPATERERSKNWALGWKREMKRDELRRGDCGWNGGHSLGNDEAGDCRSWRVPTRNGVLWV